LIDPPSGETRSRVRVPGDIGDIARENRHIMMNAVCEMILKLFGDIGRQQLAAYELKYDTTGRGRNYEKMQLEAQKESR